MHIRDVVEISRSNGRLPARLIEASYQASQDGLVALVLRDISPQTVNLILDPIVPSLPLNIPGVLYIDADDETRVREAVLSAEIIFAATADFRAMVCRWGVAPRMIVPVSHAHRHGHDIARRMGDSRGQSGVCDATSAPIPTNPQTANSAWKAQPEQRLSRDAGNCVKPETVAGFN
ncbi:hypothetical protein [Nitratireductor luteus]|uniref:hypothetical protein n=1 Tax=Nitratireductor luteus TaxID=2976980 RepID=UPI00223FACC4|nr:hypothetical protein [Nitratireductor luteus]